MYNMECALNDHNGPAKGNDQKHRGKTTEAGPEEKRTYNLQPAQIEFSAAIDSVQCQIQMIISSQKLIAMPNLAQLLYVWQLELISADRVSKISHREIPTYCYTIQCLLHQFFRSNLFGYALGD